MTSSGEARTSRRAGGARLWTGVALIAAGLLALVLMPALGMLAPLLLGALLVLDGLRTKLGPSARGAGAIRMGVWTVALGCLVLASAVLTFDIK